MDKNKAIIIRNTILNFFLQVLGVCLGMTIIITIGTWIAKKLLQLSNFLATNYPEQTSIVMAVVFVGCFAIVIISLIYALIKAIVKGIKSQYEIEKYKYNRKHNNV